jgi:putative DNA primase/helicase
MMQKTWSTFSGDKTGYQAIFAKAQGAGWVNPKKGSSKQKAGVGDDTSGDPTQPEPLRAPMPPADPYPVEMLGDVLGAAAQALHEVIKAPLALCCQSVLGAGSLAAQSHFDVKLPWETTAPLSLFLLTVGESGERKSAVDDIVLGAAKEQQKAEMLEYNELLKDHEAASAAWNQAIESAKKSVAGGKAKASTDEIRKAMDGCGEKPTPPISPMRFVTDPTVEGLFKLLAIGQPSVALFSDEGGLLIGGHALNSDNALKTMARWCKLWDGSEFDRVRSGDGSGILYGRRMALHQLSQPDVMVKLLSDPTANGQGFLARCLTAWPSSTIGTRHTVAYSWAGSRNELKRLFGKLKGLMEAKPRTSDRDPQELAPVALPLTLEAQSLAVEAGNIFESLMAPGNDLAELRDRGSKALENACRIAGVLAVVEGGMATREISRSHLERGVNLIQWYLNEALRIRSAAVVPQSVIDAESMLAWLKDRDCRVFRTATLLTHGPSQLRNKKRLDDAIDEAVKCGYLTEQDPGAVVDGVRAKRSWRVLHYVV